MKKGELIFQGEVHTPLHLWGQVCNQKYFKIPSKTDDEKSFFAFCLNQRLVLTGRLNGPGRFSEISLPKLGASLIVGRLIDPLLQLIELTILTLFSPKVQGVQKGIIGPKWVNNYPGRQMIERKKFNFIFQYVVKLLKHMKVTNCNKSSEEKIPHRFSTELEIADKTIFVKRQKTFFEKILLVTLCGSKKGTIHKILF